MSIQQIKSGSIASVDSSALIGQVPDANAPSGSVIQRQHTTFRNAVTLSSTSFVDIFTVNFTPKRNNSKIYLSVNLHWGRRDTGELQFAHRFLRGESAITELLTATGATFDIFRAQNDNTASGHGHTIVMGYDLPNTTSQVQYKLQALKPISGYANVSFNFNGNTGSSVFTIEEFAA